MERRVAVLYNDDTGLAHGEAKDTVAAREVVKMAEAVRDACRGNGWDAPLVAVPPDPLEYARRVRAAKPDVAFHLVEALGGDARLEAASAWILEMLGIPYTGAPPVAMSLALDKGLAKRVLLGCGVPVPRGRSLSGPREALGSVPAPWIVKPSREDASHGIAAASVVADKKAMRARVAWVIERYRQPALVEEFVDGREFNVAILGEGDDARTMPLAEIDFSRLPAGMPRVITYEGKWDEQSPEWRGTEPVPADDADPALLDAVRRTALAAYRALGLRDYGRVDLRVDARRGPLVIDVNPNPDISPGAGLARAAERGGLDYGRLILEILEAAAARRPAPPHP